MAQRGRPPKAQTVTTTPATKNTLTIVPQPPVTPAPMTTTPKPVIKPVEQKKPEYMTMGFWGHIAEKTPLFLAVSYQSFIVGLWSYQELILANRDLPPEMTIVYAIFSACAGLSLDLVMIGTALRKDTKGATHLATLFSAWIASSAIAFSYFPGEPAQRVLHITWSTMVFLFSWSLAEGRGSTISYALQRVGARMWESLTSAKRKNT